MATFLDFIKAISLNDLIDIFSRDTLVYFTLHIPVIFMFPVWTVKYINMILSMPIKGKRNQ